MTQENAGAPPVEAARMLSAHDIGVATDLARIRVEVPEWKGVVYLRELSAEVGLRLNAEMSSLPKDKAPEALFLLLAACLCDDQGVPLFKDSDEASRALRPRSTKVLTRLQQQALELLGWKDAASKNG